MVSRQSNLTKSLSDFQKQSNPAEWIQGSLILPSSYLGLEVVYPYRVVSFQNYSRCVHMSDLIILGNPQRLVPSS